MWKRLLLNEELFYWSMELLAEYFLVIVVIHAYRLSIIFSHQGITAAAVIRTIVPPRHLPDFHHLRLQLLLQTMRWRKISSSISFPEFMVLPLQKRRWISVHQYIEFRVRQIPKQDAKYDFPTTHG